MEGRGLYHIYRERQVETVALRGADITLARGSWTSLMGPSGSGKSTLVHVLAGLVQPSGGSVLIGGTDITSLTTEQGALQRRHNIGVVLQRDNLHPLLDAGGNVALPLRLDGRRGGHVRARVREQLGQVGLSEHGGLRTSELSGGEAQRVAIATALAAGPHILLADELTGELDEATSGGILDLLGRLQRHIGLTILTVTHNPLVAGRADRRLVIRDGLVVDAA